MWIWKVKCVGVEIALEPRRPYEGDMRDLYEIYERGDTSSSLSATSATQAVPVSANDLDLATLAATKIVAIHRQQQSQRQLVSCLPRPPFFLYLQTHNFPACRCSNTIFMCNQNENKPRKWREKKEAKPKQIDLSARGTHKLWLSDLSESVSLSVPLRAPPVPLGVSSSLPSALSALGTRRLRWLS